jgi:hypothetical protein
VGRRPRVHGQDLLAVGRESQRGALAEPDGRCPVGPLQEDGFLHGLIVVLPEQGASVPRQVDGPGGLQLRDVSFAAALPSDGQDVDGKRIVEQLMPDKLDNSLLRSRTPPAREISSR